MTPEREAAIRKTAVEREEWRQKITSWMSCNVSQDPEQRAKDVAEMAVARAHLHDCEMALHRLQYMPDQIDGGMPE